MKFVLAVRSNKVLGPMRRGFSSDVWNAEYSNLGTDESDARLHAAGIRIHEKANNARAHIGFAASGQFNAVTKVRTLVALANHEVEVIRNTLDSQVQQMTRTEGLAIIPNLDKIKIRLRGGDTFLPDEVVQSVVDGLHFPLREILTGSQPLVGIPKYARIDWDAILLDWNVGNFYQQLEQLWNDCLWNGYYFRTEDGILYFEPANRDWSISDAVSHNRRRNLSAQSAGHLMIEMQSMTSREIKKLIGVRGVKRIRKEGRNKVIDIKQEVERTEGSEDLLLLRAHASEPYYTHILSEAQSKLSGASINELFNVWGFIRNLAAVLRDSSCINQIPKDQPHHEWLPTFAPLIKVDQLVRSAASAANISYAHASSIVNFLTYKGRSREELWTQPLVPAGTNSVSILFGSLIWPAAARLVDVWMKQLKVDLGRRGPAFEQHVRDEIAQVMKSHNKLPDAKILPSSFRFRPAGDREEEIDVVLVLNDLVLLGEAKCMQHPTESKEIAIHRQMVADAAKQVRRKADAVSKHREQFLRQMQAAGVTVGRDFSVLPLVILNAAIHAGLPVEGVAVADMYIVRTFLSGEMADAAILSSTGFEKRKIRKLFRSPEEAATNAPAYFNAPPQLTPLLTTIRERWVSIGSICEGDWRGLYLTFEPHVDVDGLFNVAKSSTL